MVDRPTTLNSLTHYSLTEEQQEVMEEDDNGESLRDALQRTPLDPTASRTSSAIESGLLLPRGEMERLMGETQPEGDEQQPENGEQQSEQYEDESDEDYQERLRREDEERRQQQEQR